MFTKLDVLYLVAGVAAGAWYVWTRVCADLPPLLVPNPEVLRKRGKFFDRVRARAAGWQSTQ